MEDAIDWMFVFLQYSYVQALIPNVVVFGGEAFGRQLDLGEAIRVGYDIDLTEAEDI